jgi:hypothetical protein
MILAKFKNYYRWKGKKFLWEGMGIFHRKREKNLFELWERQPLLIGMRGTGGHGAGLFEPLCLGVFVHPPHTL